MPGTKWSDLPTVSTLNEADIVCMAQGGTSKQVTRAQLRKFLADNPQDGDALVYRSASADWVPGAASPWKGILASRYTTTIGGTPSVITMSVTSDMAVGLPVRYVVSGSTRYGIITALTANTSITVAGPSLVAAAVISALAVGTLGQVHQMWLPMVQAANYSTDLGTDHLSVYGLSFLKWQGPKAYCVAFSGTHKTVTSTTKGKVNLLVNGARVSTADSNNGIQLGASGAWVDNTAVEINTSNYDVNYGESIEVELTVVSTGGSADDYLTLVATFVEE